jgi:hypothetical protein
MAEAYDIGRRLNRPDDLEPLDELALKHLGERIREARAAAIWRSDSDPEDEFGEKLPWVYAETPAQRLEELLQRHTLNERVMHTCGQSSSSIFRLAPSLRR